MGEYLKTTESMKVLMFGWEFPPHITGGLGTACYGLTKGLARQGVQVIFAVPRAYGDESQESMRLVNASDVCIDFRQKMYQEFREQIMYMEVSSSLLPYVNPEEFNQQTEEDVYKGEEESQSVFSRRYTFSGYYGKNLMDEMFRYSLVAAAIASKYQFDVIHAHDWLTYAAGIAAKKVSGKPLVVHMHATEFDRSGENINQNIYDLERKGMETADRVIAVSNYTRNIVINRYGIHPDKVITVHNAVEPTDRGSLGEIKKQFKEKVVTFLGRVTFQKGPDYFVEAAHRVLQKDKNVRFVMAGSGDMLNRIIKRVAELRISSNFHFTGFLQGDEVDHMFALSDVYVMPSVSEPFGISPLEAMRSNVPVVISKQSGVSEVLKHALKVNFWDIDEMANAIYGLLHYKALSQMFQNLGRVEVDNLKWENAALQVKYVYEACQQERLMNH